MKDTQLQRFRANARRMHEGVHGIGVRVILWKGFGAKYIVQRCTHMVQRMLSKASGTSCGIRFRTSLPALLSHVTTACSKYLSSGVEMNTDVDMDVDMDVDIWTCGHGHVDTGMWTWVCGHGHSDMDMWTWTCRCTCSLCMCIVHARARRSSTHA